MQNMDDYDALGRRIWKEAPIGTITKYIYDNEDILFQYDYQPSTMNYKLIRYTHGPGIDEPLIMERDGKSYYYHFDGLGSVSEITDEQGNIVNYYVYDSFGNIMQSSEAVKNHYTYTSREYDSESGLYYYRARYYDAKVGRFLSKDLTSTSLNKLINLGLEVLATRKTILPDSISHLMKVFNSSSFKGNFYIFVDNNPLTKTDVTGADIPTFFCWNEKCTVTVVVEIPRCPSYITKEEGIRFCCIWVRLGWPPVYKKCSKCGLKGYVGRPRG